MLLQHKKSSQLENYTEIYAHRVKTGPCSSALGYKHGIPGFICTCLSGHALSTDMPNKLVGISKTTNENLACKDIIITSSDGFSCVQRLCCCCYIPWVSHSCPRPDPQPPTAAHARPQQSRAPVPHNLALTRYGPCSVGHTPCSALVCPSPQRPA